MPSSWSLSAPSGFGPELKACHVFLDAGDTLVVPSLDRYGRSLQDKNSGLYGESAIFRRHFKRNPPQQIGTYKTTSFR